MTRHGSNPHTSSPGIRPASHSVAPPPRPTEPGVTSPPARCFPPAARPLPSSHAHEDGRGIGLTARQAETLAFITAYQAARGGISPSLREIGIRLGVFGKSTPVRILEALEERGHIRRLKHRACAIEVINPAPVPLPSLNGEPLMFVPVHAL